MQLTHELNRLLAGRQLEPVSLGESGAAVWRCTQPGHAAWYLKSAPVDPHRGLEREAACMRWMREFELPVPAVLAYRRSNDIDYLLSEAGVGVPASDSEWAQESRGVAAALGHGLARLHSPDVTTCPFDRRVQSQLDEARDRIAAGRVNEDDFDAARRGRAAADLFVDLLDMVPQHEDLVLVHSDFCLPNVLLSWVGRELQLTGLVDCGRAGLGDRHQDLALAIRSLIFNFGGDTVATFLSAYGGAPIDSKTLEFFTILDEFF